MSEIFDFLTWVYNWITQGIYDMLTSFVSYAVTIGVTWYYKAMLWNLEFSWNVAKGVLSNFGIAPAINSALAYLDADARAMVNFFQVPAALNLIIQGSATKFVMRIFGW